MNYRKFFTALILFLFLGVFSINAQDKEPMISLDDEFFQAFNAFNDQNFDESILKFEQLSAKYTKEATVFYYLGKSYWEKDKVNLANESASKAYSLEPGSFDIALLYIKTSMKIGDNSTAIKVVEAMEKLGKSGFDLEMLKIQANLNLGNYDEAIQSLEDQSKSYFDFPEIIRTKQFVYARLKKWKEFAKSSEIFAKTYPEDMIFGWEIYPMISPQFFPANQIFIDSLYQEFPDQKQLAIWKADYFLNRKEINLALPFLHETLADARLDSNQIGKRIIQCFDLVQTIPAMDSVSVLIQQAQVKFPNDFRLDALLGDIYYQKNQETLARKHYQIALDNHLGNEMMWSRMVALDFQLNDTAKAQEHLELAIQNFPLSGIFYYQMGFFWQLKKDFRKSIDYLNQSLQNKINLENYRLSSYILLGDAYHDLGDHLQSDQYFDQVLAELPEEEYVLNNYSFYLPRFLTILLRNLPIL